MLTKSIIISLLLTLSFTFKSEQKFEKIKFTNSYKFNSEIELEIENSTKAWKHQLSAGDYATKGDYKNALKQWDLAFKPTSKNYTLQQVDSINSIYKVVSAIDYIIEQSKKNQLIVINEAHHNSSHRLFTKSLLKKLYDKGYKNLGLEALANGKKLNSELNQRKYPVQKTGHYIKDPQFGDLVRTALEIGYNVFPYEQTTDSNGKFREIEQAKNIQKIIKQRPNEKFLIHCGFDHNLEGIHTSWEKAMAARLTEYTGINPLTINQVIYSEKSKPEWNHPLLKAVNVKESSVLIDQNNMAYRYVRGEAWTDIAVFHPTTIIDNQRPNWLFKNGNKKVKLEIKDLDITFPIMALAFKKGENIKNAVPVDILEVENNDNNSFLALKSGAYEVVIVNQKNEALKFELKVN